MISNKLVILRNLGFLLPLPGDPAQPPRARKHVLTEQALPPTESGRRSDCHPLRRAMARAPMNHPSLHSKRSLWRLQLALWPSYILNASSMEASAKYLKMGSADCRKRLQNSVWFSSASFQWDRFHCGGSRAGSVVKTISKYSAEEGGHRGGPSS